MNHKKFYLLVDTNILCSYLVSKWIEAFGDLPNFQGVIVKEKVQPESLLKARNAFHAQYSGQKHLTDEIYQALTDLYPNIEPTEQAMIERDGIAPYSSTGYSQTIFLGDNLNGVYAKEWLIEASKDSAPLIFVCVTQILKPWWIEMTQSQLFNCHSAILPYGRGMYSVENIAILQDVNKFREVVGVTIHYIDQGVDTGLIIKSQRIIDPFQFDSIWALKAYSYLFEFDLYLTTPRT
ncbi:MULTISPECIES: formyltransferase family protein [Okeania]|uniref:Formyl transferase N-terminal domain-containing protein n=1 Tax=Okeania hirsuta TaxID=1458930 RepID=A0A3N6P5L2_9CYAN|nr:MULTISPECIES: formyltransferase family protein [Okeania]NES91377.1 hypothetical protein [Okeania sp. SIO2B9]NET76227.1 hypothetical protein [Okeania sp. SIO1F9]RQH17843.1 hypothetical protein D4Z78_16545 [Okeania hirsuta]RQH50939.1 hypothetical protein D5R40_06130 [Okeania hirsuta]